jgi:steroid delta-isomerase-like uncharacterized protein
MEERIMPMEGREELMLDYLAAWNAREPERIASFFTDDAIYEDQGAGLVARGRERIQEHAARVHAGFPDLHFELVRAAHGEDFTAGEWNARMTHLGKLDGLPPTGRVIESSGVDVATLDPDGRITHLASYYDGAGIMRVLGLLPERGSGYERVLVGLVSGVGRVRRLGRRS